MRKLLSSIVVAGLTLGSTAFAADLTLEADGTGDYIVVPAYFADQNGWETNIKVVNTDTSNAVVAKIVFREHVNSVEKLDFLLYLTPGDEWEGTVYNNNGNVAVKSTDDTTVFEGVMTTPENPLNKAFAAVSGNEDSTRGYVEVFAVSKVSATAIDPNWVRNTPLDKVLVYNAYKNNKTIWQDVGNDDIYVLGNVRASNEAGNLSMTEPAVPFGNFAEESMADSVIAGQNTTLGAMTHKGVREVLEQIDNLIYKRVINVNYANAGDGAETKLGMTVPTKKYWYELNGGDLTSRNYTKAFNNGVESDWIYNYAMVPRDQMEHTPLPRLNEFSGEIAAVVSKALNKEVSIVSIHTDESVQEYKDGWAQVGVNMPVLPFVMNGVRVGNQNVTNAYYPTYLK